MTAGELKAKLANVPDDVNVEIEIVAKGKKIRNKVKGGSYICSTISEVWSAYGTDKVVRVGARGDCSKHACFLSKLFARIFSRKKDVVLKGEFDHISG